ncbi:MAG: hypothetical protein KAW89_09760, partial [Armatimonadetes bacterium]|nr:hypothetical protein [Armatimonadota bacterium]
RSQGMDEARVDGTWVYKPSGLKLVDASEALHPTGPDEIPFCGLVSFAGYREPDVVVDWVADQVFAHSRVEYSHLQALPTPSRVV